MGAMLRGPLRFVAAIGFVSLATLVAYLSQAGIEARLMLLAVVGAALLGRGPGLVAVLVAAALLNFVFQNQAGAVGLTDRAEFIGLISFLAVALVIGTLVSRDRASRRQAELGEREALLRVDITDRLLEGEPTPEVANVAARSIVETFGLIECTLVAGGVTGQASAKPSSSSKAPQALLRRRSGAENRTITVTTNEASLTGRIGPERDLSPAGEDVLTALVSALGTAFMRAALERSASDARVDAEVNRSRAAFFAAAGHNLRTPLAAVDASVSALLDTRNTMSREQESLLLSTIAGETSRLGRMVNKVLSQSQIHGTNPQPDLEPVDLEGMVQVAVQRLGPLAADHQFDLDVPPDVGPLWLDITMCEQILLNLLENAARFAPAGSTIAVTARNDGDDVELRVIDHGPGVQEEERERIFDEFHRSGRRTEGDGTGLGLSIVRALVSAHGGTVQCETTPGGGATFVARFARGDRSDHHPQDTAVDSAIDRSIPPNAARR
jgi:two-component system, OmpR family, sensor histidine kinase KdpD